MKKSNDQIMKYIYILSAILLGISLPLFESLRSDAVFSQKEERRMPVVAGVKVSVVEMLEGEGDVTLVSVPQPLSTPGSEFALSAKAAVVIDKESGNILFSKKSGTRFPIASITKLFTALVVLEHNPDWEEVVTMKKDDEPTLDSTSVIYRGEQITVKDLWYLAFVKSDNRAARALMRTTGLSEEEFVRKMNQVAHRLGLSNTKLVEPTGLSKENVSTAGEVSKLLEYALENEYIHKALITKEYTFQTLAGRKKRVTNTDKLLRQDDLKIIGGKTGYTDAAGFCFTSEIEGEGGQRILITVLGASDAESRFKETRQLAEWTWKHWKWLGEDISSEDS